MEADFRKHDGGFMSRKFWVVLGSMGLVLLAGFKVPAAAVSAVVSGIVSIALVYVGGNTASRWVMTRDGAPLSASALSQTDPSRKDQAQ